MLLTLQQQTARLQFRGFIEGGLRASSRLNTCPKLASHVKTSYNDIFSDSWTRSQKRWAHKAAGRNSLTRNFIRFKNSNRLPSYNPSYLARHHSTIPEMATIPTFTPGPADEYRLPKNVKPTHYDLTVKTDLEKLEFDGFVKIRYLLYLKSLDTFTDRIQSVWMFTRRHHPSP